MKATFVALVFAVAIAGAPLSAQESLAPAQAPAQQPGGTMGRGGPGMMLKMMTNQLNLTQDQQDRLKAIVAAAKDWMTQHRAQHVDQLKAFIEEFKKDQLDEAKLDQLAQVRDQERRDAQVFMRQTLVQVHRVLTPEQRAQAAEKIGQFVGRWLNNPPNMQAPTPKAEE